MKRSILLLLTFLALLTTEALSQKIGGGILVESNAPVEVFINGQRISSPTYSCMVANLRRGNYLVEVYAASTMGGPYSSPRLIFRDRVNYTGNDTRVLRLNAEQPAYGAGVQPMPMDASTFSRLLGRVRNANFESERLSIIDLALTNALFTTDQARQLALTTTFESERLTILKRMYPNIVDKERVFLLEDVFQFSSNREEFIRFVRQQQDTYSPY